MALHTINTMLVELRISASINETPDEGLAMIVMGMMDTAESEIESYAPDAPTVVKESAQVRYVGWLYESSPVGESRRPVQQNGFRDSGAMPTLSRWHTAQGARA